MSNNSVPSCKQNFTSLLIQIPKITPYFQHPRAPFLDGVCSSDTGPCSLMKASHRFFTPCSASPSFWQAGEFVLAEAE